MLVRFSRVKEVINRANILKYYTFIFCPCLSSSQQIKIKFVYNIIISRKI